MDEVSPACQSQNVYNREGQHHDISASYRTTYEGGKRGNKSRPVGTAYYNNNTDLPNTHGWCKQAPNPALVAGVGTAYPWYYGERKTSVAEGQSGDLGWYRYNQTLTDTNNYYWNQTGLTYQTIYDVNNINGRCHGSYPALISTPVNGTNHHVNVTWTNGIDRWRNETTVQGYYGNTTWTDNTDGQNGVKSAQGHGTLYCHNGHGNVSRNGQGTRSNMQMYGARHQNQSSQSQKSNSVSQAKETLDGVSRKRKLPDETEVTANNQITNPHIVDKRALYSKFRVVKKTDRSPPCNQSSKVTPNLWRVKLDDKTIVYVNYEDGLPINAKMTKVVPTLTPVKENEAAATIGNIKFITLENMKVARRKLEVVLAMQQGEERQERLRLEAKVTAKVKINAKERTRKDKKRNDRKRQVKIGV